MAVTVDATSSGSQTTGTNFTFSHTCTGSDRMLLVLVALDAVTTVTSITYNGINMGLAKQQNDSSNRPCEIWYLAAPATGSNTVSVTTAASTQASAGSISFNGAAGVVNGGLGTSTPTGTTYSLTVTSNTGDMVVDVATTGNRTWSHGGSQTAIFDIIPTDSRGTGTYKSGAATVQMDETISSAASSSMAAVNVVAGTQSSNPLLGLLGVGN